MPTTSEALEVVILCGGKGTRAYPDTLELPKPLLPVGGLPIVEHVMRIYARQGHQRFILAAGYLGDLIAERYADRPEGLDVEVVDTGDETETGERLRLAAGHVKGERFFATYADGVGDVDVNQLLAEHVASGALGTVTTVPLPSQYGILESGEDGRIHNFREKPRLHDHWINGGFFVFEKAALDHWRGEILERDVLPALAEIGGLHAYRHQGFWKSMDTYKDRQELDSLARGATPPWAGVPLSLPVAEHATAGRARVAEAARGSRSALALAGEGPGSAVPPPVLAQFGSPSAAAKGGAPTPNGRRATIDMLTGDCPERAKNGRNGENGRNAPAEAGPEAATAPKNGNALGPDFLAPGRRLGRRRMGWIAFLTALLDVAAIMGAYRLVGGIHDGALGARLVGSDRPELLWTVPVWLGFMAAYGLYDRRRLVAASEEARRLLHAVAMGAIGTILVTFAWEQDVARSWVAVVAIAILLMVGAGRFLARAITQLLAARGVVGTRVLVVGTNEEARAIARTLDRKRWLGYCPVGLVETNGGSSTEHGFPVLGHVDAIDDAVTSADAGAVVIAATSLEANTLNDLCDRLQRMRVDVRVSAGLPQVAAARVSVAPLDGLAVLSVRPSHQLSAGQKALKRAIDIVAGSTLLLFSLPIVVGLAVLVRATSRGPAFFRQVRVGAAGKPFVLHKLRTMSADAEEHVIDLREQNQADGLLFKLEADPRVTPVGRWLRRWGLDELPQLWNVVKGEMSLVGPRPPLPSEARRYDEWVRGRLEVKPGITGLWQVNGGHLLRFDDYVRYDLFYVENWSIALDLYVLFRTFPALLMRRGMT